MQQLQQQQQLQLHSFNNHHLPQPQQQYQHHPQSKLDNQVTESNSPNLPQSQTTDTLQTQAHFALDTITTEKQ